MEWEEISRRLRNGTSVQILADLAGCTYKTMYNRIRQHERKDGKKYIKPEQMKRPFETKRPKSEPDPEEKKDVPEVAPVIVTNDYSCKGCAHCMQTSFNLFCEMGHECGENCVCSDYKTFPDMAQVEKPEFLTKRLHVPEVEPIGEEKAPDVPEVVEKVADVPEVVKEFAGIPEGVVKETLEKYKKEQANAVGAMHAIETMYKLAKARELKLRTVVLALERLLEGGGV